MRAKRPRLLYPLALTVAAAFLACIYFFSEPYPRGIPPYPETALEKFAKWTGSDRLQRALQPRDRTRKWIESLRAAAGNGAVERVTFRANDANVAKAHFDAITDYLASHRLQLLLMDLGQPGPAYEVFVATSDAPKLQSFLQTLHSQTPPENPYD